MFISQPWGLPINGDLLPSSEEYFNSQRGAHKTQGLDTQHLSQSTGTVKHPHTKQTQTTAAFRGTSAHKFAPSHPSSNTKKAAGALPTLRNLIHCKFICWKLYLHLSAASPVFLAGSGSSRERLPMNSDHSAITKSYCHSISAAKGSVVMPL